MKNPKIAILASCLAATLLFAGCNSATTLQTYPGDPLPLEQVAVLVTSPDSCPIYNIDGEYRDLDRQPGAELHLMPGSHVVEVFYQKKAPNNQWKIERTSISYNYKAGQVYTIQKTSQPLGPQTLAVSNWSPTVQELGDVVNYAINNPDYSSGKQWKQLRKDNGLNRSLMDYFKKDKAELASESDVIIK